MGGIFIKKILQVVGSLRLGGLETVAVNYMKFSDTNKYEFTYLVYGEEVGELENEILERKGKIIRVEKPTNLLKFFKQVFNVISSTGPYDVVHSHPLFNSGIIITAAYYAGVPKRIVQAHSSQKNKKNSFIKIIYQYIMRKLINKYSTHFIAVSKEAGHFVFGEEKFEERGIIIKNGIDVEKYRYNELIRKTIREKFNIKKTDIILGHVGTMNTVKNQEFLIKLMDIISQKKSDYKLLLVGDGPNFKNIHKLVNELNLSNYVILAGMQKNVHEILQAMDIYLFPSLYEGMPLALLEAQSASLPCIVSDAITTEAILNKNIELLPLNDQMRWVESIEKFSNIERGNQKVFVEEKGFGIRTIKTQLNKLYS